MTSRITQRSYKVQNREAQKNPCEELNEEAARITELNWGAAQYADLWCYS